MDLSVETGIPIVLHLNEPLTKHSVVSAEVDDLPADEALNRVFAGMGMQVVYFEGLAVVLGAELPVFHRPWLDSHWESPDVLEAFLAALQQAISDDRGERETGCHRIEELGHQAVGPLMYAVFISRGEYRARLTKLYQLIVKKTGMWILGSKAGIEKQSKTELARTLSRMRVSLKGECLSVRALLDRLKVQHEATEMLSTAYLITGKDIPVIPLLKAISHPFGLDFRIEGGTLDLYEMSRPVNTRADD